MRNRLFRSMVFAAAAIAVTGPAFANGKSFKRIATLANYINNDNRGDETVSEIVAATSNGRTLVYTDSELETIGFVFIGDPSNPIPTGTVALPGEPTSVAVWRNRLALVGVDTSESLTDTSGVLAVVDINTRSVLAEIDLGGQPDSVAISPDSKYAAIAIENERDEELCVGGTQSGAPVPEDGPEGPGDISEDDCEAGGGSVGIIPQTAGSPLDTNGNLNNPPGFLAVVQLTGSPANWSAERVDLSGLSTLAPSDPEPEFVDINERNQAVVTLQENNHIAIVSLRNRRVINNFDLGTVDLEQIDAVEDDVIRLTDSLADVPREPDAVAWANRRIATANEGDMFGGSRGFSLFTPGGRLVYDSGNEFEHLAVRHGHYPEDRSENKGSEPEAIEFGVYDNNSEFLFVGSERGSFVAVYELRGFRAPRFKQFLPGPLGPEGLLAIPQRDLLVVSGEVDDPEFGVRSSIMIYEYSRGEPTYPQIQSANLNGVPIGFSALSGMDTAPDGRVLAVWDSFYSESRIFTIDTSQSPATIVDEVTITGGSGNYDPEGIAVADDGSYWIASEGNGSGSRLNRLLHVDATGTLMEEIQLPAEIEACRAAERDIDGNTGSHGGGFEGVALSPTDDGYRVLVAQQRGWDYTTPDCEELDDDPDGSNPGEPRQTRIWSYDPTAGEWSSIPYALAAQPENASWVGLSEITRVEDGYLFIERDNRTGDFAELKTLVKVSVDDAADGVEQAEKSVFDLIPDLESTNGWITDKAEGIAVSDSGEVYMSTDNDGVDDWSGETWFINLGDIDSLFE